MGTRPTAAVAALAVAGAVAASWVASAESGPVDGGRPDDVATAVVVDGAIDGGHARREPLAPPSPRAVDRPPAPSATPAAPSPTPTPSASPTTTSRPRATPTPSRSVPTGALTLDIPAVGMVTAIVRKGLGPEGTIDPDPGRAMWFDGVERVAPGRAGTTVLAGHVVAGGEPDVFADLADVRRGDLVTVRGDDGVTLDYRIVETRTADKHEVSRDPDVWGANDDESRLALITCDDELGFRADGHRVANFVAIAELV